MKVMWICWLWLYNAGNRRLSAHTEFNGLSHLKKPDTHRTDLRRPVKLETAPRAKGVDYPQSQNASIASGRQYILHFSYTVPSEHSMCNCHKKQDLDAFLGFSNFNLRPELREVISELDFDNPTKGRLLFLHSTGLWLSITALPFNYSWIVLC